MLNKFVYLLIISLVCATGAVQSAELKIGFVNVAKVLEKAPQAERATKNLESEFSPRNKRLIAEQKELQALEEKLSRDSAIMSDSERQKAEREFVTKKRAAKRAQEEFREDFSLRRNEEMRKLQKQVFEAIKSIAKQENYDLLLTDGVVYASDQIDVTLKIQDKLKSSFQ